MAGPITPTDGIIAIVETDNGDVKRFLGTGFFVGDGKTVITAKHVVEDALKTKVLVGVAQIQRDGSMKCCDILSALVDDVFDIAVLTLLVAPSNLICLSISREQVSSNIDVLCVEYSQTVNRLDPNGERKIVFNTLAHKGNVVSHYLSDFPETAPTPSFDTSFPALKGASGAPVIRGYDFVVVGMLVANRERHLLPAQIERIDDSGKIVEERSYFLPMGKALEASVIADFLERHQIAVTVAP
ncbi:hypothetical protein C5F52_15890 [Limnohabitans sp. TS-CS-82]|uniref:S1 family peptidase n=1 Tax=Limnohabitans sp. TS-CS-82 TaxID=2094193 RepID=UPI000CF1FBEB|nr:serine protease [Limnohabitans sp. TS-CS-82]PQA81991.1 hypothetical protein C5F52_15890 [Limnohabitans sp. TS-CS-82]